MLKRHFTTWISAAAAAGLAAMFMAPAPASAQTGNENFDNFLICLQAFFEGSEAPAECGTPPPPPAGGSIAGGATPCEEPLDVRYEPMPEDFQYWSSIVITKCGSIPISMWNDLPVYRFQYVGTPGKWFYGLMIEDVLRDGRFIEAVHTLANGMQVLDYTALGLIVPDAQEMREAGWKAMQIVQPLI